MEEVSKDPYAKKAVVCFSDSLIVDLRIWKQLLQQLENWGFSHLFSICFKMVLRNILLNDDNVHKQLCRLFFSKLLFANNFRKMSLNKLHL